MAEQYKADMDFLLELSKAQVHPDIPIVWDPIKMFMQEVDVLFSTSSTDVLCAPDGWPNLKEYVFNTNVSAPALQMKLNDLIQQNCPTSTDVDWDIECGFVKGEISDIGIITLTIRTGDKPLVKDYYIG